MNRTGVVVVTYNSAEVIERCLDSCGDLPVVVIDNASGDGTPELVRGRGSVVLIANADNRGFAGAVNQGVAALGTELILLLNPDAELTSPVDELEQACGQAGTGLAAGKLVDEARPRPARLHAATVSNAAYVGVGSAGDQSRFSFQSCESAISLSGFGSG